MSEPISATVAPQDLGRFAFFEGLNRTELELLAPITRVIDFKEGEPLFTTGDIAHSVFVVREGFVNVMVEAGAVGKITVSTIGPGEACGWSGIIPPHYFSATGVATVPGSALAVSAPKLRQIMADDGAIAATVLTRVAQMIAGRLRDTRYQLIGMLNH